MNDSTRRKQSFLLRLPLSVREEAMRLAFEEGTSLNFLISMAVAEKITQMQARQAASVRLSSTGTTRTSIQGISMERVPQTE